MRALALLILAALAAPAATAQTDSDELDLVVTIAPYAHVLSLDDDDDDRLVFDFAPGLDPAAPTTAAAPDAIALDDEITFATNITFDHQVDVAVEAANAGDWNSVTITVTPGTIATIATSTGTSGTAGSCGTAGTPVALTADDTEIAVASGIRLCHASQTVTYEIELDAITADQADRTFDVTYTILQTSAPGFPGG